MPGDRLDMEVTLLRTRSKLGWVSAEARVDGKLACTGELMFSIANVENFQHASVLYR